VRKHRIFLFVVCCLTLTTLAFGKTNNNKTIVTYPSAFAVSQPLSELPIDNEVIAGREMPEPRPGPLRSRAVSGPWQEDPVLQTETGPMVSATPGVDFDGIPANGFAPSDSNIAVGPNHIVETVNARLAVYSKSGTPLAGPTNLTTFFAPLGDNCASGASDPIVLYDRAADRWLISDVGFTGSAPFLECVGVSKTNDPTGAYTLYSYSFGTSVNDYPKLSTWATTSNSAYLATYNIFLNLNPNSFAGADLCGLDRTKMLAGNPGAAQLCMMTPNSEGGYLPSDMDGPTRPTNGTPGLFITWQNNNPGQLFLRKLTLNFTAGTATLSAATTISVANDNLACGNGGICVPQSGTTQLLDTLGDRLMYRFPVRHFADHDRATASHAVANGTQVAMRWYELFDPAGAVTLNQQGTFAPDTTFRWMGSMAEDRLGDIAMGYSASSTAIHPAIRFTGRVPSDPLGMLETEASILEGTGSQTGGLSRWGDYTAMQVDPSDDCTFWYVNQYEKISGSFNWATHIGSFAFTGCGPDFTIKASPSSLTIPQGGNGTSTTTVTSVSGFNSATTLDASGLPSGVTAAFATNPVTPPANGKVTSTLTLTASNTATTGTATVTITGTSGSLVHTTTITLTVHQGLTVSVTDPPAANPGQSTATTMQIATTDGNLLANNVTYTCSAGLPAGATCSFLPLQLDAGTSGGSVTITVQTTGPFTGLAGPTHSGPQHKLRGQNQRLWLPLSLPLASMVFVGLAGRSLPRRYKIVGLCLTLALTGLLVACGGGGSSSPPPPPPPPPPISVSVTPNPVNTLFPNLNANGTQAPPQVQLFKATVNNSTNQTVNWEVNGVAGGNATFGTIDTSGNYAAPATLPSPPTFNVTAVSQADTSKSGNASVTIQTPTPPVTSKQITVTVTEGTTVQRPTFHLTVN
jgi:hypothetical protein